MLLRMNCALPLATLLRVRLYILEAGLVLLLSQVVEPHARARTEIIEGHRRGRISGVVIHISIRNQLPSKNHANYYTCGQKIIGREKLTAEM